MPDEVQRWEAPSPVDALVVVAYPGYKFSCLSSLLPKLVNDGAQVQVVYVCDYSRQRIDEGMAGLWSMGIKLTPLTLGVQTNRSLEVKHLEPSFKKDEPERLLPQ